MTKDRYQRVVNLYNRKQGALDSIKRRIEVNEKKCQDLKLQSELMIQCDNVFKMLLEVKKQEIKDRIENLVTKGLRTIFERDDYEFVIKMEIKRGVMSAKPMLISNFNNDKLESDIIDSHGGGLVDVTSFLLQVIVMLSLSRDVERLIIADEPFKHVSREYLSNIAEFMKYLNEISDVQLIIVTHKSELIEYADKAFDVRLNNKKETIIEVIG